MLQIPLTYFLALLLRITALFTPSSRSGRTPGLQFGLRHEHAVSTTGRVVFKDALTQAIPSAYTLHTKDITAYHPSLRSDAIARIGRASSIHSQVCEDQLWEEEEVLGPDVESRETLLELAKMTNNAYVEPDDSQWYDLGSNWTNAYPVGWEPDEDGFRGHVFATPDNSTIVLSIKGTSAGFFGGGGPTAKKDKLNDNLLFSCCCARVDWTWTPVCGCYRSGNRCDIDCLERSLIDDSLFYPIGTNLYNNLTYMYPESNIWIIGHSLGGALASLLGVTFGVPVVTFESPGEKMAAGRLHLPSPPSTHHVTHVYHTADPIPMGTCNGILSSCALAGYAMESRCHLGRSIIFDTVSNLSWAVDIRTHGIVNVIENLLSHPWAPSEEVGREVPEPTPEDDCVECYDWEFGDFPQ
ncbi:alpha/beta-hydrolase [Gloeophyllum trabeum ATCC 11539]|uniref:triacylglycerol lipase n=1 Tax=Gloeophyllum trabeum (strain ATCC 11539 / FP-39264 / Madison 617) TaxID=670483 RepID=S7RN96_GLOTA|nr:alpha/beta-hydrolase [Gloeophyllum trabeum ATCC 11539]EPQ54234.1 alpha/beta-hydrolase [Gloeophyllum trabeum ATCC 11539]